MAFPADMSYRAYRVTGLRPVNDVLTSKHKTNSGTCLNQVFVLIISSAG